MLVAVVAGALVVLLLLAVVAVKTRYEIASPSEALIVVGEEGRPVTNPQTGEVTTDLSGQEVIRDRVAFARQVEEGAVTSLNNQGLVLDTLQ
ncbi:hypothetical protein GTR00_03305, partial [Kineococcus sp. T90]|nr:hypothetical protein [Kineococcus indalonis]